MKNFKQGKKSAILRAVTIPAPTVQGNGKRTEGDSTEMTAAAQNLSKMMGKSGSSADYERELYKIMLRVIDARHGHKNWKAVSEELNRAGVTTWQGRAFTEAGARAKFYKLHNKFTSGAKLSHFASQATGKVFEEDSAQEAKRILKLIESALKLDADPETKLALIRKLF